MVRIGTRKFLARPDRERSPGGSPRPRRSSGGSVARSPTTPGTPTSSRSRREVSPPPPITGSGDSGPPCPPRSTRSSVSRPGAWPSCSCSGDGGCSGSAPSRTPRRRRRASACCSSRFRPSCLSVSGGARSSARRRKRGRCRRAFADAARGRLGTTGAALLAVALLLIAVPLSTQVSLADVFAGLRVRFAGLLGRMTVGWARQRTAGPRSACGASSWPSTWRRRGASR